MLGCNIVNDSTKATRHFHMTFGIGNEDDIDKARSAIQGIIDQDKRVLKDPAPMVVVSELADYSVNFMVRIWTKSGD